jgi:hypothetical protein
MTDDLDKPKNWAAKMRDRKPPRVTVDWTLDNTLSLGLCGDWARILQASGNLSVANGLLAQAAILGSHGKRTDQEATDFVTGFVDAMEPNDASEALLLTQMAATHQATMMLARRLNHVENIPQQDAAERALNKLARTFAAQMDTLKRYRLKGQQTVRVERVTVQDGGQAIVGTVNREAVE